MVSYLVFILRLKDLNVYMTLKYCLKYQKTFCIIKFKVELFNVCFGVISVRTKMF